MEINDLIYDHNYYFYKCFINYKSQFIYEILSEEQLNSLKNNRHKIICINKNIPQFFHKIFLYYKYNILNLSESSLVDKELFSGEQRSCENTENIQ
jgi:hypothetical protein